MVKRCVVGSCNNSKTGQNKKKEFGASGLTLSKLNVQTS